MNLRIAVDKSSSPFSFRLPKDAEPWTPQKSWDSVLLCALKEKNKTKQMH